MITPTIKLIAASFLLLGAGAAWFFASHRPDSHGGSVAALEDEPLAAYQGELLDIAFRTASKMPIDPHVKDRSRAQEAVVSASLQLDQPARALRYAEGIENWRRGASHANVALWLAKHGKPAEAAKYLESASRIADEGKKNPEGQEWRRDRIRALIARTWGVLGNPEKAAEFGTGLSESEAGGLDTFAGLDGTGFDAWIVAFDATVKAGNFDRIRHAFDDQVRLYEVFWADGARRAQVEDRVRNSYAKLPAEVRIGLLKDLAGVALAHGDRVKALELVEVAQSLLDGSSWLPRDRIPIASRLVVLRYRAGDVDRARRDAAAALALFEVEAPKMVDIERAAALRPVAEAHQTMGDTAVAMKAYGRVLEEGMKNPNSRPRAEDLSATCVSMALHAFEPDPNLRARLVRACDELRSPW